MTVGTNEQVNRKSPGFAVVLATFSMLLAPFLLGALYQVLIELSPLVILNALVTLGVGVALGKVAGFVVRLGRCSSSVVSAVVGVFVGLMALGAGHVISYYQFQGSPSTIASAEGVEISVYLKERMAAGWDLQIKSDARKLQGGGVVAVWLVEAVILIVGAVSGALFAAHQFFCTHCGEWIDKSATLWRRPGLAGRERRRLKNSQSVDELIQPPEAFELVMAKDHAGRLDSVIAYEAAWCDNCNRAGFMTIYEVRRVNERTMNVDVRWLVGIFRALLCSRRNVGESRKVIWENVALSPEQFGTLKERGLHFSL